MEQSSNANESLDESGYVTRSQVHTFELRWPCTCIQGPSCQSALACHHLSSVVLVRCTCETEQNTKQTRGKVKTEVWPEMSPSTVFPPSLSQLCGIPGTSFACFEQHEPHHCSSYPSSVNMRTTSMLLSQRVSFQLSGGHREHTLTIAWSLSRWSVLGLFPRTSAS